MVDFNREVVALWLSKADNDLLNIRNNLDSDDVPTDTICFHAQQAIEKLFKSLLVAQNLNVPKSHDLVKLMADVADIAPELLSFENIP